MNELTITGTIKEFLTIESGVAKSTGNEWQKQQFVISNNDGYEGKEQVFCFEVFGSDKVGNLTKYQKVGDLVKVSFNFNVNKWQEKYYTSLSAWRIEKVNIEQPQQPTEDVPF